MEFFGVHFNLFDNVLDSSLTWIVFIMIVIMGLVIIFSSVSNNHSHSNQGKLEQKNRQDTYFYTTPKRYNAAVKRQTNQIINSNPIKIKKHRVNFNKPSK
jgi:hypothetical protein